MWLDLALFAIFNHIGLNQKSYEFNSPTEAEAIVYNTVAKELTLT